MSINDTVMNENKPSLYPDIVDEIICINLKTRPDRKDKMIENFPYSFKIFEAELHENPIIGCLESHLSVIRYAKEKKLKNIMIIEDDIKIVGDLNIEFPKAYNMLYFGGLCTYIYGNEGEWILGKVICAHAYIINENFYDIILSSISNTEPIDIEFARLSDKYKYYISKKPRIVQRGDYSDIDKKIKWSKFKWNNVGELWSISLD